MLESIEITPVLTFLAGVSITGIVWVVNSIIQLKKNHAVTRQSLQDHFDDCGKRAKRVDNQLDDLGNKIDDVRTKVDNVMGELKRVNGNK